MLLKCVLLIAGVAIVSSEAGFHGPHGGHSTSHRKQDDHGHYSFGYHIKNGHGAVNGREEKGSPYGPVVGSYYIGDIDGRHRTVEYVADKLGFRAFIKTNEPGTKTSLPAAAHYASAYGKTVPSGAVHKPVFAPAPFIHGHAGYGHHGGYGGPHGGYGYGAPFYG